MIWDVFRGQKTESVIEVLPNTHQITWPTIINHSIWQQISGPKNSLKRVLAIVFRTDPGCISGKAIEDTEVKVPLSVMKPLHGCWLIEMYDKLTSANAKKLLNQAGRGQEY